MFKKLLLVISFSLIPILAYAGSPVNNYVWTGSAWVPQAGTAGGSSTTTTTATLISANKATYRVYSGGYTAYATPTDLYCIFGSNTKTVYITGMGMQVQTTAAALQTIDVIKRSTANTGGNPTTLTAISYDSTNAAATAAVTSYASAPSLGTAVATVETRIVQSATLTATPAQISFTNGVNSSVNASAGDQITAVTQPFTLRGTGESLCFNYKGAALTGGFTAYLFAEWVEQ